MKRYNMKVGHKGSSVFTTIVTANEEPDGEWVRYEDVEGLAFTQNIEGVELECESVECNCGDMVERATGRAARPFVWICPAHGYKRL